MWVDTLEIYIPKKWRCASSWWHCQQFVIKMLLYTVKYHHSWSCTMKLMFPVLSLLAAIQLAAAVTQNNLGNGPLYKLNVTKDTFLERSTWNFGSPQRIPTSLHNIVFMHEVLEWITSNQQLQTIWIFLEPTIPRSWWLRCSALLSRYFCHDFHRTTQGVCGIRYH